MNTLLMLFILWVLSKLFFGKVKDRFPNPTIPQPGGEVPSYKLPPELRDKWGPKKENEKTTEAEDIILADPPSEPHKYTIVKDSQMEKNPAQASPQPVPNPIPSPALTHQEPQQPHCWGERLLEGQELTPGMLRKGIILTEILGPPLARRRSGRTYQ